MALYFKIPKGEWAANSSHSSNGWEKLCISLHGGAWGTLMAQVCSRLYSRLPVPLIVPYHPIRAGWFGQSIEFYLLWLSLNRTRTWKIFWIGGNMDLKVLCFHITVVLSDVMSWCLWQTLFRQDCSGSTVLVPVVVVSQVHSCLVTILPVPGIQGVGEGVIISSWEQIFATPARIWPSLWLIMYNFCFEFLNFCTLTYMICSPTRVFSAF